MITGPDLRAAREQAGIGLARLANLINRDKGHLSRVERATDAREVTPALIADYERALGTPIAGTATPAPNDAPVVDGGRRGDPLGAVAAPSVGAAGAHPAHPEPPQPTIGPLLNRLELRRLEVLQSVSVGSATGAHIDEWERTVARHGRSSSR